MTVTLVYRFFVGSWERLKLEKPPEVRVPILQS
jgi:hypothetical protein